MSEKSPTQTSAQQELRRDALKYHELPRPGKIAIQATKQLVNQRDLALAYTPGVAAPCEEIARDPNAAFKYTSKGNLVAVVTNVERNGRRVVGYREALAALADLRVEDLTPPQPFKHLGQSALMA